MAGPDSINSGPSHMYCEYTHKHFLAHVLCRQLTLVRFLTRIKINLFDLSRAPAWFRGVVTPHPDHRVSRAI